MDPALREKAPERLRENKLYTGGRRKRNHLLSGLIECVNRDWTYVGSATSHSKGASAITSTAAARACTSTTRATGATRARTSTRRGWSPSCGRTCGDSFGTQAKSSGARARERVREQLEGGERVKALEQRLASLQKRLAAKHSERERAMRLYTRGLASEEEIEVLLADLKNQADNLRLLTSATEGDLSAAGEERLVARNTEAWLLTLRKNLAEVEQDTDEAFRKRRELVKLLIEKIGADRDEEGRLRVDISYRFSPPGPSSVSDGLDGVRDPLRSRQTLRPTRTKK